uniref:Cysteine-rich protein n=1 Tax=Hyaloperonospora arabidopsidis TaxID=272952 RepID=F6MEY1_HYAAB|nr:cysteine-rich protein [Hyaloperonospora arabidopsidis]
MNIKGILTIVVASMVGCPVTSQPNGGLPDINCTMVRMCDMISDEPLDQISNVCNAAPNRDTCCTNKCYKLNCVNAQGCSPKRVFNAGNEKAATLSCSAKYPPGENFNNCCTSHCSK